MKRSRIARMKVILCAGISIGLNTVSSFTLSSVKTRPRQYILHDKAITIPSLSSNIQDEKAEANSIDNDDVKRSISAANLPTSQTEIRLNRDDDTAKSSPGAAKTNTINERLMSEVEAATQAEKGPKTKLGKTFKGTFRYSDKTDEERELALEEAKDLNGVNPTVTILASFFAFGMAYGFWGATQYLADLFLTHPVSADAPYAFARAASVFRNIVMGLSSLISGFSLVSGIGVFLLGVRVAYGVATGELDPTPIRVNNGRKNDDIEIPNVWDLMMNKKSGRKRDRR